jgi:serine/threonine protein kinase
VHRDLKPGNILIAADGPRVIDFGISRTTSGTVVTATQVTVGTPAYMSPEQAQGFAVGPASDIFSLGSVLAFAATGVAPFGGGEAFSIGFRVVHGEPDLARVPEPLRPVIDACLAKDPDARPALGPLMETVAVSSAAYPEVTPGRFWPDQVSAVLESVAFRPALPPSTIAAPSGPATHPVQPATQAVQAAYAAQPGTQAVLPGTQAVPQPGQRTPVPGQSAAPAYTPSTPQPVVRRRRGPRWLLPVVLAVAVLVAVGIAIALAVSPSPKPPGFLPGESGSATATASSHPG